MPNFVKNILSFDGDPAQVDRLFSAIKGENGPMDFNKLIPMPSELEIEAGSRTTAGFKKYMEFVADTGLHTEMEPAYLAAHPEIDREEWALGKQAYQMLRRIEPTVVLCYHQPFPEMEGNIVTVSYESSSWQSLQKEKGIEGQGFHGIIVKKLGFVQSYWQKKGSGSAYGGKWKPAKPKDERFVGKPGSINRTVDKYGNQRETKIGKDGLAISERHHIHHGNLVQYSIPHDHDITWENHYLNWGTPKKPGMVLFQNSKYMEEAS